MSTCMWPVTTRTKHKQISAGQFHFKGNRYLTAVNLNLASSVTRIFWKGTLDLDLYNAQPLHCFKQTWTVLNVTKSQITHDTTIIPHPLILRHRFLWPTQQTPDATSSLFAARRFPFGNRLSFSSQLFVVQHVKHRFVVILGSQLDGCPPSDCHFLQWRVGRDESLSNLVETVLDSQVEWSKPLGILRILVSWTCEKKSHCFQMAILRR